MASDSRSPAVPAGGPPPASPGARSGAPRRASGPGSGAESPSSWDTGCGRKGGRPLARHAPHVRGEPGAKPFVDDLLLGRGFVRSRAAPSLRSIESQPSTQGFVARAVDASVPPSLSGLPPRTAGGRRPRGHHPRSAARRPVPRDGSGGGSRRARPRTGPGPRRPAGGEARRPAGGKRGGDESGGVGGAPRGAPHRPRARRAAPPPHPAVGLAHGLGRGKGGGGRLRTERPGVWSRRAAPAGPAGPLPGGARAGAGGAGGTRVPPGRVRGSPATLGAGVRAGRFPGARVPCAPLFLPALRVDQLSPTPPGTWAPRGPPSAGSTSCPPRTWAPRVPTRSPFTCVLNGERARYVRLFGSDTYTGTAECWT